MRSDFGVNVRAWGPVQVSSYTPWWGKEGWRTVGMFADPFGYHPEHYPKSYALRHPRNYVIPVSTYVPKPPRYRRKARTVEEIGREGQDLGFGGWFYTGTRGS